MSLIRSETSVPDIYVKESRDFLLLCRLYDFVFSSNKLYTDEILSVTDTRQMLNTLLKLLSNKLGLSLSDSIKDDQLRKLLEVYPYIKRYKGSLQSLVYLVNVLLKIFDVNADYTLYRTDADTILNGIVFSKNTIILTIYGEANFRQIIDEMTSYIMPPGFIIHILSGLKISVKDLNLVYNNDVTLLTCSTAINSLIRTSTIDADTNRKYFNPVSSTTSSTPSSDILNRDTGSISHVYVYGG